MNIRNNMNFATQAAIEAAGWLNGASWDESVTRDPLPNLDRAAKNLAAALQHIAEIKAALKLKAA